MQVMMYWEGDRAQLDEALRDWAEFGIEVSVFDTEAVREILVERGPASWPELFDRITISACRSDIARWVLVHEFGGLFVDAHAGPPVDMDTIERVERLLGKFQLVIYEREGHTRAGGHNDVVLGVLAAREGSPEVWSFVEKMFAELEAHEQAEHEAAGEYVPYNIYVLTGGWGAFEHFYAPPEGEEPDPPVPWPLQDRFADSVLVEVAVDVPARQPALVYKHYSYRRPGRHWSERQQDEFLFARRRELTTDAQGSALHDE